MSGTAPDGRSPNGPPEDLHVRRAGDGDLAAILRVARRSLGWDEGEATEAHFAWKHLANPFGPSPMWVAEIDRRVVGFRTFLRWELLTPAGAVCRAVRAVDTATDPDFQGRGVFTALTLGALEELRAERVDFVFNTPNAQSRPGYLKMGWHEVGRLPVGIRPVGVRGWAMVRRARVPADRHALACDLGSPASAVFADVDLCDTLLASTPVAGGLATRRSAAYLAWRYGHAPLHYRVVTVPGNPAGGAVVFHLRRRGPAVEAVICDVLARVSAPRAVRPLLAHIAADSGADYLLGLRAPGDRAPGAGLLPAPRVGPILTARALTRLPPSRVAGWAFTLGDIEAL